MTSYKFIDISSVIQISDWHALDEELAGSRVKRTMANPDTDELFVFKEPKPQREAQIWSEVIASFISGDLLGWPVQHAQIAMKDGRIGNLLKYVFDPKTDTFVAGEQLCKHVDPEFDPEQGKRHTWDLIKAIHDKFIAYDSDGELRVHSSNDYYIFWMRTVAFDTLISNTDRHAENWALRLGDGKSIMAPFYDNASSLGCEVDNTALSRKWFSKDGNIIEAKVASYIENGCHHLRNGAIRFKFEALTNRALSEFPNLRSEFEAIANLNLIPVEGVLNDICEMEGVPEQAKMTSKRCVQITRLLHEGQARVIRALERNP